MEKKKRELKQARGRERSVLAELEQLERRMQQGARELAENRAKLREAEDALREWKRATQR
jgi:hypothetical protein